MSTDSDNTLNIEIDGRACTARKGQMLIEVADANAIPIPRFCYHRKLTVAANCRMCLVEVEKAPKALPACATPVAEGMRVFTRSKAARNAQKSVMEFLLINHPLDCPICDQGGECELQDLAMGYGRDISRFNERKRVVVDKNLGPLIATDMTRCIHCTRCVRFGEEIAGMPELGVTGRGEAMEIGTFIENGIDNELSGNVIDLCPVGALTSKPFRFSARSWEMAQHDGIAPHDPIGSNIHLHVRRGQVMRVLPKANESINEVWISDRDRFGYEGLRSDDRVLAPMLRDADGWREAPWEEALDAVVAGMSGGEDSAGDLSGKIAALASPSSTLEELFLFQRLLRGLGSPNIDHRLRQHDFSDQEQAPSYPTLGLGIDDIEGLDAAFLVGSITRKEHPLINHRLRKASLRGAAISYLDTADHPLNLAASERIVVPPSALLSGLVEVAGAAARIAGGDLEALRPLLEGAGTALGDKKAHVEEKAQAIARALIEAERGAILIGPQALGHRQAAALRGIAAHLAQLTGSTLGTLDEGANAAGAWIAGAVPHRGPQGTKPAQPGLDALSMLHSDADRWFLLGVEPELDCAQGAKAKAKLEGSRFVVALSAFRSQAMLEYAHVILPIATFAETGGTFVNMTGTWQSFKAAALAPGESRPAWRILRVLGNRFDLEGFDQRSLEDVRLDIGPPQPASADGWRLPPISAVAGDEPTKGDSSKNSKKDVCKVERIAPVPIHAVDSLVRRSAPLQATDDALRAGAGVALNPATIERFSLAAGASVRVRHDKTGDEIEIDLVADESVPEGCAYLPSAIPSSAAIDADGGSLVIERSAGK
ncbi:NADH-quinone oxidoreductase subunit NuoG [Thioalkalivibrio sp. HK1]|uniref:NADH-quinone oxidoreductase subunit NuoG n=1 Tax=Thioalkalivibrio sp. HK1 TaxID=1469245 RepID=UPI0004713E10|nr:NADH-quinone oxidoreductase subunit NuoG [Thioalkalivibrio sp. HK1]